MYCENILETIGNTPGYPSQFQNPFLSVLANHQSRFVGINMAGDYAIYALHPVSTTWDLDNGWTGDGYIPNYVDRSGTLTMPIAEKWPAIVGTTDIMNVLSEHNSRFTVKVDGIWKRP